MRRAAGIFAVIIAGCGDGSGGGAQDVPLADVAAPDDVATNPDAPPDDTLPDDGLSNDVADVDDVTPPLDVASDAVTAGDVAVASDTADDASATDVSTVDTFEPDPACEYIDMVRFVVKCKGLWVYGGEYTHFGEPNEACVPWFGVNGGSYLTLAEGLEAQQCDATCVNRATMSVSAVYCRADCQTQQRYGWITYEAEGCPTLYELPGGLFLSVADWFAGQTDVCADGNTACLAVPEVPEIPEER